MLLDTNIVIDGCKPGGGWLSPWTDHPNAAIAGVTRVEALGFTGIGTTEEIALRTYLGRCPHLPLDDEVIERAISLRQKKRMKLGDVIIAATALEYGLTLVTRNTSDFDHIGELNLTNPFDSRP
jgi:predicted nucleic acid-binding protein